MRRKNTLGLDSVELNNGKIKLLVSTSVGPRILSLSFDGGENIFAELPHDFLEFPGDGNFYFYGGHRFWLAPEEPAITYIPDNRPITIKQSPELVELIQDTDETTCIQKSMQVRFTDFENIIIVDHLVHNRGKLSHNCAPWAITQLKLGGKAIIPQHAGESNKNALLPDRSIVLWSYTDIQDPRITWGNDFIIIDAQLIDQALKIGVNNKEKWVAYLIKNILFIKYAENEASELMIDKGATHECYCNSKFVELETLGPMTLMKPEKIIRHREVWRIVHDPFTSHDMKGMLEFFKKDKMADKCLEMLKG